MNLDKFLDGEIKSINKELSEKRGVLEHPKAAAKKRKETEKEHYGKKPVEAAYKTAEKMKGKSEIDNPFALAKWQKYPQFAGEREAAAEKAARSRKKKK